MKDIDKIFFRLSWWQYLRWQPDDTKAQVLTLFFNHCSGIKKFDYEQFNENNVPTLVEQLVLPMVQQFEMDKCAYISKCETNSKNAKSKKTTANGDYVPQATASDRSTTVCENDVTDISLTKEKNGKESKERNGIIDDFFSVAEGDEEKNKNKIILFTALQYLNKGILQPYEKASRCYEYNVTHNWLETTKKGKTYDHGITELSKFNWLKAAYVNYEKGLSRVMGNIAAFTFLKIKVEEPVIIDGLASVIDKGQMIEFVFSNETAIKKFRQLITELESSEVDELKKYINQQCPECKDICTSLSK